MFCRIRPLLGAEGEDPLKLEYPDQGSDDRKLVLSYQPSEVCVYCLLRPYEFMHSLRLLFLSLKCCLKV